MTQRRRTNSKTRSTDGDRIHVTIRVDRAFADRFDGVLGELKAHGLRDVEAHARFLIVNGSIAAARAGALEAIDGVASVREDREYRAL